MLPRNKKHQLTDDAAIVCLAAVLDLELIKQKVLSDYEIDSYITFPFINTYQIPALLPFIYPSHSAMCLSQHRIAVYIHTFVGIYTFNLPTMCN